MIRRIFQIGLLIPVVLPIGLNSQTFLNGSFENTTATSWANNVLNNLRNDQFNALVPNCHSYGELVQGIEGHLDLMHFFWSQWTQVEAAQDGDWYVGLGEDPRDRLAMELSQPLVPGADYTISYYEKGTSNSRPITFGLSTSDHENGTVIHTTASAAPIDVWTERIFSFTATNNGTFITLRQTVGMQSWVMIDHFTITLNPCEVSVDLGADQTICRGEQVMLDAGMVPGTIYQWSNGSAGQFLEVSESGTWSVTLAKPGCSASDEIAVSVEELPTAEFSPDVVQGCAPLSVHFSNDFPLPGQAVSWDFGDGTTGSGQNGMDHVFQGEGCFTISITVVSEHGCTASSIAGDLICIAPKPVAAFYHSPTTVWSDDPTIHFYNTSVLSAENHWDFGDGYVSEEANPVIGFPGIAADHPVRLIVFSDQGCSDTVIHLVAVEHRYDLYVPNAFTPDGNELNNIFLPVIGAGYDLNDYALEIYNRWGELLFESRNANRGWDGVYAGQLAEDGAYVWEITIGDLYSDARIVQTGTVSLVR